MLTGKHHTAVKTVTGGEFSYQTDICRAGEEFWESRDRKQSQEKITPKDFCPRPTLKDWVPKEPLTFIRSLPTKVPIRVPFYFIRSPPLTLVFIVFIRQARHVSVLFRPRLSDCRNGLHFLFKKPFAHHYSLFMIVVNCHACCYVDKAPLEVVKPKQLIATWHRHRSWLMWSTVGRSKCVASHMALNVSPPFLFLYQERQ